MLNMSAKIGEARERMILKMWKCTGTSSPDCRIRSPRASSKGASANSSRSRGFEWGDCGVEGMPVMGGNWRQAIGSRSSCALVHIVSWQPQVPATGTAAAAGAARRYSNQLRLSTRLKKSRFTVKGKARHVDTGTAPCHRAGGSVQGRASGVHLKYRYRESSNFNNCLTRGLGLESAVSTSTQSSNPLANHLQTTQFIGATFDFA
jgi:hypothetical protein